MLYYATNGDVDIDGQAIRAAIRPRDSDGVSLGQVSVAIQSLTSPSRVLKWSTMTLNDVRSWLDAGLGLVVNGYYGAIPFAYREQARADFNHAVWISNRERPHYRVWDPLNKNLDSYGRMIPDYAIEPFIRSLSGLCGWITLEPLAPPAGGNPLMNLVPTTCHRVVALPKGTVLYKTPGGDDYTTLGEPIKLGYLAATSTHYFVADGDAGVYVLRTLPNGQPVPVLTEDKNVGV
jgi:hypothetical protein